MKENSSTTKLDQWDSSSFLTKWTFSVANSLLKLGVVKTLQFDDLLEVPSEDVSSKLMKTLKRNYRNSRSFWFVPRLMVALLKTTYHKLIVVVIFNILESSIRIAIPVVLIFLLRALQSKDTLGTCYMWAAILGGLSIFQTIAHHVLFFFSMCMGWNWKNACTAMIHDRLFFLNSGAMQNTKTSTGMLVNLISNDVARFEEFSIYTCHTWEALLEVVAILVILIYILNVPAAFAGVGCTILLIPAMVWSATKFAKYRSQTAAATDQRVRYVSELIDGIASVKSYAWETPFFLLIRKLRAVETKNIAASQFLKAVNQAIMFSTSTVAAFATFAVYWGNGGTLTIPKVFATLSLLQVLRMTVGSNWLKSIERGSEAFASCKRIEAFFSLVDDSTDDTDVSNIRESVNIAATQKQYAPVSTTSDPVGQEAIPATSKNTEPLIGLAPASYYHGADPSSPVLRDIQLSVSRGEILVVVGPVGCGKSSLLSAVLGEISTVSPSGAHNSDKRVISSQTTIAYCAQRPWILASSVKSNIALAGSKDHVEENFKRPKHVDAELYALAVESSLIVDDLRQWPAYDDTEVGEKGISISGGQKARISLARAVYSDADLYVLDDPLSAVDAHVGKALFFRCIVGALKNRNKGVILVTHQLQYLKYADKIIVLDKHGLQTFCGSYESLLQHDEVKETLELSGESEGESSRAESTTPTPTPVGEEDGQHKETKYDPEYRAKLSEKNSIANKTSGVSEGDVATQAALETKRREIVATEDKAVGSISMGMYWNYISAGGAGKGVFVLLLVVFSQTVSMITDYWLRWWASEEFWAQSNNDYVIIYAALMCACVIMGFLRCYLWFQFTLVVSNALHEKSLWAVMHSPLRFFISNPTGRILNRFAKDQNQADEALPVTFFDFLQCALYCLSAIVLICVTIPWLILLLPFLFGGFYYFRNKYICSAREIKRIEAVTRSPLYADFSATLEGLVTLRAYRLEERVSHLFQQQIDENGQAWFSFLMVSRWLGFRLDLESATLVLFVAMFAVILRDSLDVGLIGFALVYSVSLSSIFQWTVRQSAEVETQMTSIERITAYSKLESEEGYRSTLEEVLKSAELERGHLADKHALLPSNEANSDKDLGHLELKDLTVTYRHDLDPVLRSICVDIPPGAKVGICGRTGSGKSSTLLALLRLNIITGGDILLDGVSLLTQDLESARSLVSIIPQEPHLFSGTVRFNLDPFNIYSDETIWAALRDAHIFEYIQRDAAGLSGRVEEGGKNFSVGQRQLLSLARAILRRCKVVLMDEVTASIDFTTDRLIQETIRTSPALRDATIITVAHRLRTIADSDLIVVIQAGVLVEQGRPRDLLTQNESFFRKLAEESNELDEITRMANRDSAASPQTGAAHQ